MIFRDLRFSRNRIRVFFREIYVDDQILNRTLELWFFRPVVGGMISIIWLFFHGFFTDKLRILIKNLFLNSKNTHEVIYFYDDMTSNTNWILLFIRGNCFFVKSSTRFTIFREQISRNLGFTRFFLIINCTNNNNHCNSFKNSNFSSVLMIQWSERLRLNKVWMKLQLLDIRGAQWTAKPAWKFTWCPPYSRQVFLQGQQK